MSRTSFIVFALALLAIVPALFEAELYADNRRFPIRPGCPRDIRLHLRERKETAPKR